MGFVRVTNISTGEVEYDSRRDELSDKANEYIDWLGSIPGDQSKKNALIESATSRERAEQIEKDINSPMKKVKS